MSTLLLHKKILAPQVLCADGVLGMSVVEVVGKRVVVTPFTGETHSTVYIGSPVAILKAEAVEEYLLDDIELAVKNSGNSVAIKKLDLMFRASGLYHEDDAQGRATLITIE